MRNGAWWRQTLLGAALGVLLLAVFTGCGALVLWIVGAATGVVFDNLLYNGFRVGVLAGAGLLAVWALRKKKGQK